MLLKDDEERKAWDRKYQQDILDVDVFEDCKKNAP